MYSFIVLSILNIFFILLFVILNLFLACFFLGSPIYLDRPAYIYIYIHRNEIFIFSDVLQLGSQIFFYIYLLISFDRSSTRDGDLNRGPPFFCSSDFEKLFGENES